MWKSIYWKVNIRYTLAKIGKQRLVDPMQWAMTLYWINVALLSETDRLDHLLPIYDK